MGGSGGVAFKPSGLQTGTYHSDVWLDATEAGAGLEQGTIGYVSLLHEIAHAIGLDHPNLPVEDNDQSLTLMSATPAIDGLASDGYQLYDIAAIQFLYGSNDSYASGDDTYVLSLVDERRVIWDSGGLDTIDASQSEQEVQIDLTEGGHSIANGSLIIAYGVLIENAIGSAFADVIKGNEQSNVIDGDQGNDTLTGGGSPRS